MYIKERSHFKKSSIQIYLNIHGYKFSYYFTYKKYIYNVLGTGFLINRFNPVTCLRLSQGRILITLCRGLFVFSGLRREVVVRF